MGGRGWLGKPGDLMEPSLDAELEKLGVAYVCFEFVTFVDRTNTYGGACKDEVAGLQCEELGGVGDDVVDGVYHVGCVA